MDEPLAYLDFESANTFVKYVAKLASSGASIIVFENNFSSIINEATEIYELANGRLRKVSAFEARSTRKNSRKDN